METSRKSDLEKASWDRGFKVTREPKPGLFAAQILDPCYFRDAKHFYDLVAERFSGLHGIVVTADEIEGIARLWADKAALKPMFEVETLLFPYLEAYASSFRGWIVSGEAMVIPIDCE